MEGVEFTMTFLRVLKWISFIVVILSLALAGAAQGFIFYEMNLFDKDDTNNILMSEVKDAVDEADDIISAFLNKDDVKEEKTDESAAPQLIEESTSQEADEAIVPTETKPASSYSVEGKNEIIVSVMKYGSYQVEFDWLNEALEIPSFKINLAYLVAYIALFITFVLHIISKQTKTVYGYIFMFIGYILFAGIVLFGYVAAAYYIETIGQVFVGELDDFMFYRTCTIIGSFALALFIGLPYYRVGVRQIANKALKKRIDNYKKKLQRRGA